MAAAPTATAPMRMLAFMFTMSAKSGPYRTMIIWPGLRSTVIVTAPSWIEK